MIKKAIQLILTAVILFTVGAVSYAGTGMIGAAIQPVSQSGTWNVVVTNAGTFAVQAAATLAAETTKIIGTVNIAAGQTLGTVTTVGAVTSITNALPAGTNLMGKVGIDQTTPGTTNKVSIGTDGTVALNAAIPAGANAIGKLAANTGVTIGAVEIAAAQTVAVTNAGTFAVQIAASVSVPAITKVGATGTSAQLIAANATRKYIEIETDCANTDSVAINFGAGAAVYATHKILPPCASWQAPAGVSVQTAIQVISNSGTQQVRVIEYP